MAVTLGVLDGDGIGPETVPAAVRVVEACANRYDFDVDFRDLPVGWEAYETDGTRSRIERSTPSPSATAGSSGRCSPRSIPRTTRLTAIRAG
jgi:isocitrate/isopropylmalate dehydrogenase